MTLHRALISVSDKEGLLPLAQALAQHNIEILATGNTAQTLKHANIPVTEVSDYTGYPEILGGRVKTLHPQIHGGILARRGTDEATLETHAIKPIDLVIVNLYPFLKTIQQLDCTFANAIENIDIGGPALLRAAAKNHRDVIVIVDPQDYVTLIQHLTGTHPIDSTQRLAFAQKAFAHTAHYDATISRYLNTQIAAPATLPAHITLPLHKQVDLRYGENPHQHAAFYGIEPVPTGLAAATQVQGKPLSYNNLLDADAALATIQLFKTPPTCVIVKHATPCGVAQGDDLIDAYKRAYATDPTSAFGGIIAFNQTADEKVIALILEQQFVEVILAPAFTPSAKKLLTQKPNVRALSISLANQSALLNYRSIQGGLLVQETDQYAAPHFNVVTQRAPNAAEKSDLEFAWRVVQTTKSNAIVYAKDKQTLGIGTGLPSRVGSIEWGLQQAARAEFSLQHAVLASEAFFPFTDSIELAANAGITAIIQPGGAMRDKDVISAADKHNIAMIFTGVRHFRH